MAEDDDEYGKPKSTHKKRHKKNMLKKKGKKKKLAKKLTSAIKEEFSDLPEFERPNGGWVQEYKFSCNRCEPGEVVNGIKQPVVVVGFEASVDHMNEKHGQFATPDKQFQVHNSFKISKCKSPIF